MGCRKYDLVFGMKFTTSQRILKRYEFKPTFYRYSVTRLSDNAQRYQNTKPVIKSNAWQYMVWDELEGREV